MSNAEVCISQGYLPFARACQIQPLAMVSVGSAGGVRIAGWLLIQHTLRRAQHVYSTLDKFMDKFTGFVKH